MFQKGKFYTLPILEIVEDEGNAYFKVKANDGSYLIRMFDFQRKDPEVRQLRDLPVMVKDIHGDNIVFVQNFARMFGKDYKEDEPYLFTVQNQAMTEVDGQYFYNVRDNRGVVFKLTTPSDVFLVPGQRIFCKVRKDNPDRLKLEYCHESKSPKTECVTLEELLSRSGTRAPMAKKIKSIFSKNPIFSEARTLLDNHDILWVIKAVLAVPDYWISESRHSSEIPQIVGEYIRLSLYLLEESRILLSFPESERENYQEWIAKKIRKAETHSEVLEMDGSGKLKQEIDTILHKIRNSGFIYRPEHKIDILIAIFSMRPLLLEERIDDILDIIEDNNWSRRNSDFRRAFCLFMTYYIDTNRDKANRTALVNDENSNRLLSRMIRSLSYLLLMNEDSAIDLPLYRSLLFHYLSYVRYNNTIGVHHRGIVPSENLLERAFQALMLESSGGLELSWNSDIRNSEIFAYRMASLPISTDMLTTKSFETDTMRFTVNNNRITLAPTISKNTEHNVVPSGLLTWHDIQIFLPDAGKYGIARNSTIRRWKEWWRKVDLALSHKVERPVVVKTRKMAPEVGEEVQIRVLWKDESDPQRPYRYYCRIEDDFLHGEGWLDVYGVGATTGLFRYNPNFDINSFYHEGKPLLFKAKVNSVVDPDPECPTFMFDVMNGIDIFVRDRCWVGVETDACIIYHDKDKGVYLAITSEGYGVFLPEFSEEAEYSLQDFVKIEVREIENVRKIQAKVLGPAEHDFDIKDAAEGLLLDYCDEKTFQESEEQLAKDALSLSDDQFDPCHIRQMIVLLDHKALMEKERASAYGYLSVARLLAKMTADENAVRYLDQRLRMLAILEDFGKNGRVDNEEFAAISVGNEDFIENYPLLKEKLCQIRIVDSLGRQERNSYLWRLAEKYPSGHLVGKLARLMLSYNVSDGMQLSGYRDEILERIKGLLNIRIAVPKIYSFGEEGQRKEFKTSIIFPPESGMKPRPEQQTLNILRVIAGMANSYGGVLYLGDYDTGTACGLPEDLEYFGGSKDKYKNYLRNQIRVALGGSFNASITEEFPDCGDKWVYALKIRPSKTPVALKWKGEVKYFLREGASTYPYQDEAELQKVMDDRIFSDYGISASELTTIIPENEDEAAREMPVEAGMATTTTAYATREPEHPEAIATGQLRHNITNKWEEGYGVDTCGFLRIYDDNTWSLLKDVEWKDGMLTLALSESERDGSLMLVYEDGEVQRVSIRELLKVRHGERVKMRADKRPLFVCPAKDTDALLMVYKNTKGDTVMRLDSISTSRLDLKPVKMNEQSDVYPDSNMKELLRCEIIPEDHHDTLASLLNLKRDSSYRANHSYGATVRNTLATLGIDHPA